jgi:5-methylcytosine-specific restriction endonuclease McrA
LVHVTFEELYHLASETDFCFICGNRLDWQLGGKGHMIKRSPTLDRLDNENEIRSDNILILCNQCNVTKRDRTLKEFLDYCEAISKKFHSHLE